MIVKQLMLAVAGRELGEHGVGGTTPIQVDKQPGKLAEVGNNLKFVSQFFSESCGTWVPGPVSLEHVPFSAKGRQVRARYCIARVLTGYPEMFKSRPGQTAPLR